MKKINLFYLLLLSCLFSWQFVTAAPPVKTPTISNFTPTEGGNGTVVTITGTNFSSITAVKFGGVDAKSYIVVSTTSIQATVGTGATGKITVTNSAGTATSTGTFTWYAAPAISYTPIVGTYGQSIPTTLPQSTGGPITSYSISPSLPSGLLFNTTTGQISGTPAGAMSETTYTVTATGKGGTGTASVKITINKAAPVLTWNTPSSIVYGTLLGDAQLNASSDVEGSFVYTPGKDEKLSAGSHELSVTFTPSDLANYESASKTVMIEVLAALLSLSHSAIDIDVAENSTVQIDVHSNTVWIVKVDQDWLEVSDTNIRGDKTVTFRAKTSNTTGSKRTANVTFSADGVDDQMVAVSQAPAGIGTGEASASLNAISIYPNPVSEGFKITGFDGKATLMIIDISGKTLIMKEIQSNDYISAGSLLKGVYILRLSTQSGIIEKKIIKK